MASSSECAPGGGGPSLSDAARKDASVSPSESSHADRRFPRSCRLTARRQFRAVYDKGRKRRLPSFTMFALPSSTGCCRLGVTVTRKVGNAVTRNRIKRVLREVFRNNRGRLHVPLDLVVNAHRSMLDHSSGEVEREFMEGFDALARGIGR